MSCFSLTHNDCDARAGVVTTAHGEFQTPAFMPIATQGSVKGVPPRELEEIGAEIVLSNTYHLHLRPGDERIRDLGGLHKFMNWSGPILTDSGGFQVFSLEGLRKVSEEGVLFQSHHDGEKVQFTPESVVKIQENLGVDIMMVLDECLPYPSDEKTANIALDRTLRWAKRAKAAKVRDETLIFGIVQGGLIPEVRTRACQELVEIGFDGYAIGGVSVGEPTEKMREATEVSTANLPASHVRYLMGVGTPTDLVASVGMGVDMFDCVIPTRSARFGRIYTSDGYINIRNAQFRDDKQPIQEGCDCYACQNFSRAYISHLIHAKEMLGVHLASLHNLRFYLRLMEDIRESIKTGSFSSFSKDFLSRRAECEGGF